MIWIVNEDVLESSLSLTKHSRSAHPIGNTSNFRFRLHPIKSCNMYFNWYICTNPYSCMNVNESWNPLGLSKLVQFTVLAFVEMSSLFFNCRNLNYWFRRLIDVCVFFISVLIRPIWIDHFSDLKNRLWTLRQSRNPHF